MLSHFLLLVLYAFVVSLFFALLWHADPRARLRLFAKLFLGLVLGSLVAAYLMYAVPPGPPVPFPDNVPATDAP